MEDATEASRASEVTRKTKIQNLITGIGKIMIQQIQIILIN